MTRNSLSAVPLGLALPITASAGRARAATVSVSPTAGPPTTKATATGSGFTAGETVTLTFDTSAAGSAVTDSAGNFTQPVLVPKSAQPGSHTVQAAGQTSGLLASATFTVQTNWPSFKNVPSRIGVNPFENTINSTNAKFVVLAWQGLMGDLVDFSSPAVVNGVGYGGSFDGKLYAFNANGCGLATCNPLWSAATTNGIYSSPAVAKGVVYVGSSDHNLYAFNAAGCGTSSCSPLWTGPTGGSILQSSPLVANGVVYIGAYDNKLYAFPAAGCGHASCAPLWTAATGAHITSLPAISNSRVYGGFNDGKLYAFAAAGCSTNTFSPLWTGPTGAPIYESSPAVSSGV